MRKVQQYIILLLLSIAFSTVTAPVTDIDGNVYETVLIGDQLWMAENLKVTHDNNGTDIGFYDYSQNESIPDIYGYMYDFNNSNEVCPENWHLPSDLDWIELENFLGMNEEESNLYGCYGNLGEILKDDENWNGLDAQDFSALPGGFVNPGNGSANDIGIYGLYWTSTENSSTTSWYRDFRTSESYRCRYHDNKLIKMSVRCLSDEIIEGCTDPEACNYDEEANVDDGSCWYAEENCECDVDVIIDHCGVCGGSCDFGTSMQSTAQAFYIFSSATIESEMGVHTELDSDDKIVAFRDVGDELIFVGYRDYGDGNPEVAVMGIDPPILSDEISEADCNYIEEQNPGSANYWNGTCTILLCVANGTCNYMQEGETPVFMIFDESEEILYNALYNVLPFYSNQVYPNLSISAVVDCNGELGGGEVIDCNGECGGDVVEDCAGVCGGDSVLDDCGSCDNNPDNDCILGCTNLDASNFDSYATDDDGSCLYLKEYDLHEDANLVSFLSLPEDASISNVIPSTQNPDITSVIGEGEAASLSSDGVWIGNLNEISLLRGYWIKSANASTISVLANELPGHTDLIYYLHSGANLISFPFDGAYPLTDVLPPELVNITTSIIGEGEATSNGVNGWIGSLTTLQGGRGYWFKLTDDIDFQFVVPGARSGVNNTRNRN